jgi:Cu+-exporting ATPase
MQKITVAGAASIGVATAEEASSVSFRVKGFTCVGCAVGLEVMLGKERGVVKARASYPDKKVDIRYDAQQTTPVALKEFINKITGFTVEDLG